ncbi:MAG TPA: glycine betaine ABC transporter substrate-binding protein [Egibacteraceae bacterium]|nr:glycine betaine ABC transporter substrate-binding protein [Egibacteraceae bacterium]
MACGVALVAGACAPPLEDDDREDVVEVVEDLSGARVTVGSKESDEQLILSQLAIQALRALGADVTDRTPTGETAEVRQALETGEIDLYWEYLGTAWTDIFGRSEVVEDLEELLEAVEELDEENGITWGEHGWFQSTDALAQTEQTAERLEVTTLTELAELSRADPGEATFCLTDDFAAGDDGFAAMAARYELDVPEGNITLMNEDRIYAELAGDEEASCNFGLVFTTDGRVGALDLEILVDDETVLPWQHPAAAIRTEVAESHPDIVDLLDDVLRTLKPETMRELNLRAAGGEPAEDIARDWLRQQGILPSRRIS